ncbi:MAG TPA: hypothetical protein PLN96_05230 [Zoogloea sp.]|uniref:hypothetical protein n=1 Tax=Zoogloea sp. TaxID=49181 RepID=UPI002C9E6190|nr:hypothetical protein [Zoogloea sp.]HNA67259.1 hypothetical protein [Rhodocyclaceae bacterium]HNI47239.1 hypothetical protein [Zoogloea sp.]
MTLLKDAWDIIKERAEWKTTQALAAKVPELERRISTLEAKLTGGTGDQVCQHCGSTALTRTGTRASPGPFGNLGLKEARFVCGTCGQESFIEIPLR